MVSGDLLLIASATGVFYLEKLSSFSAGIAHDVLPRLIETAADLS